MSLERVDGKGDGLDGDRIGAVLLDASAEQLDREATLPKEVEVGLGEVTDAGDGQVMGAGHVERRGGGDDGLVHDVDAVDVGRGVALGIAELLGLGQDVGELGSVLEHLVDDVVGGAVHDALEGGYLVDAAGLLDAGDPGDAAADRGLDEEAHAVIERSLGELGEVRGNNGLVGGDDVLTRGEGTHDEGVRRLDSAHALDDEVDVGVRHDLVVIGSHAGITQAVGKLQNASDLDGAHAVADNLVDATADRAVAEKGDFHERRVQSFESVSIARGLVRCRYDYSEYPR